PPAALPTTPTLPGWDPVNNWNARGPCNAASVGGCFGMTWQALIFPYIEQGPLYNAWNKAKSSQDPANQTVVTTIIPIYLCPSDNVKPALCQPNTQGWFMAKGNYGANGGAGRTGAHSYNNNNIPNGNYENVPQRRGLMHFRHQTVTKAGRTIAEIRDGTSNTVCVTELLQGTFTGDDSFGLWALAGASIITVYNDQADPTVLPVPAANVQTPNCDARGVWCKSYTTYCNTRNTGTDPVLGWEDSEGAVAAGSYHTGGVNVGMIDGSVRFVSNSVTPTTWYALFTINGGEVLGDF